MDKRLIERYAHKLWALAANLSTEAARAGANGKGYAVINWELRKLANALFDADEAQAIEIAREMRLLSLNGVLEMMRVEEKAPGTNKAIAVCVTDIIELMNEFIGASTGVSIQPSLLPAPSEPIQSINVVSKLVPFSVGGVPLIESAEFVREVFQVSAKSLAEGSVTLRGAKYPLVKLADINCGERVTVLLIQRGKQPVAVPIDDSDLYVVNLAPIGKAVPPAPAHKFAEYARECWNAEGGGQFVFVDWDKFA
ncbi:MAG: hypothetical protein LBM98_13645 [Oscillospiraceae bacterium]|jgi:hypothetical protein|nr:hypothetical protein [Oscillospiraceae bacterium]